MTLNRSFWGCEIPRFPTLLKLAFGGAVKYNKDILQTLNEKLRKYTSEIYINHKCEWRQKFKYKPEGRGPIIPARISCSVGAFAGKGDGRMRPPELTRGTSRWWFCCWWPIWNKEIKINDSFQHTLFGPVVFEPHWSGVTKLKKTYEIFKTLLFLGLFSKWTYLIHKLHNILLLHLSLWRWFNISNHGSLKERKRKHKKGKIKMTTTWNKEKVREPKRLLRFVQENTSNNNSTVS